MHPTDPGAISTLTSPALLTATRLSKRYREKVALEQLSLELRSGEIVGLLGPNGAGKTTSFYLLVGLIKADSGHILLDGQDITDKPVHERAALGLGYLPQESSVFKSLSTADNIRAILELNKALSKPQQSVRLEQLLTEFGLLEIRNSRAQSLSGGEKRRLELARALARNPSFMLLDEPFAGVDPISVSDIKNQIRDLSERRIGVLITDHNVRETLDICQRAYVVHQGHLLATGSAAEILDNERVRQVYLGEGFAL
ncbi:MAG TPA: LPS export ABC transporter ATP-binding protein [Gammaproteobacteria bacterium]|nr:LPS export ABC transporter ATP-binding protein [Gammaproteobacteria bacterium]|tara:strand:+ start:3073 stop:3840 length:768 start_codon:yes stop_codon:yes gene_type:complete